MGQEHLFKRVGDFPCLIGITDGRGRDAYFRCTDIPGFARSCPLALLSSGLPLKPTLEQICTAAKYRKYMWKETDVGQRIEVGCVNSADSIAHALQSVGSVLNVKQVVPGSIVFESETRGS